MKKKHLLSKEKNLVLKVFNVKRHFCFVLCIKEGLFCIYSLHILDQQIRLLPAVFMLHIMALDKFPVVLQLYNLFKHPLHTDECQPGQQSTCSKYS